MDEVLLDCLVALMFEPCKVLPLAVELEKYKQLPNLTTVSPSLVSSCTCPAKFPKTALCRCCAILFYLDMGIVQVNGYR